MEPSTNVRGQGVAETMTLGFGLSVAMWMVGYLGRLPGSYVPSSGVGLAMLACVVAGGYVAGRCGSRGGLGGFLSGLVAALLNLLVLGSLLGSSASGSVVPAAAVWVPGSLLATAALAGLGAAVGARAGRCEKRNWPWLFSLVAAVATLLLLIVGGIVTSNRAGLAVVDWPNSFGYNMFLFPLARMTGGVYYEHAHRLFGSLVGITTVALAVLVHVNDRRRWLRYLSLLAVLAVVIQGVLGGLRVTGKFTLATDAASTAPSIALAIAHGVFGQLFFGMVVAIGVSLTSTWKSDAGPTARPDAAADQALSAGLVGVVLVQLVLGAVQRHLARGLVIHITLAMVVILLALVCGIRALGRYRDVPILRRTGSVLTSAITVQAVFGILAAVAIGVEPGPEGPQLWQVVLRTAHQAAGALILACAVALAMWSRRLLVAE